MKRICKFCGKEYDWEEGQLNWTKNGPGVCNGNIRSDMFCSYKCGKKDRLNKSKLFYRGLFYCSNIYIYN